jgi:hypothetical protein
VIRKTSVLLIVALLLLPLTAQAATFVQALDYTGLQNKVTLDTYYAVYRGGAVVANPTQYQTNDILLTLYSAKLLEVQSAPNSSVYNTTWTRPGGGNDYILGFSAARIRPGGGLVNPASDPTGTLPSGAFMALYSSASNWTVGGTGAIADVQASIPVGPALATLAIVDTENDYGVISPANAGMTPVSKFYALSEISGGLQMVPGANGSDLVGTGLLGGGPIFPGVGEWYSGGQEVVGFSLVPEPGTLALWGSCLAICAALAYRRRTR